MIELFKKIGCWAENENRTPEPGDIIFYDWQDSGKGDNNGWADHVGIVEKVSGGKITVIEGNYSNAVKRRILSVNGKYIRGYGIPKYDAEKPAENGTKSVEEVAKEVIAGKYGTGAERKKKLEAEGYYYNAVQDMVNNLLEDTKEKVITDLAKEVIACKWGSGYDRMKRLEAAGYDYVEVQKKVNSILGVG